MAHLLLHALLQNMDSAASLQGAMPPESPYSAAGDDQEGCLGCHCRCVLGELEAGKRR
jgi:hypothetical protein